MARKGDRSGFWKSRAAKGDPLAKTALALVRNNSFGGRYGNAILAGAIRASSMTAIPTQRIRTQMNAIGVALMVAHVQTVDSGLSLNRANVRAYHIDVFRNFGIDAGAFAGNAITGTSAENFATDFLLNWTGC